MRGGASHRDLFWYDSTMNTTLPPPADETARRRRLALAQQAYRDFFAQCFWSYREDAEITEEKIPFVVTGLREQGGHAGYRVAAELCR